MIVKDIMTSREELVVISQMATVREAISKMKTNGVRTIVIEKSEQNGAYGLLTFKNILESIVAQDGDIDLLNTYDIARVPALTISAELDVKYAAKMMIQNSIKRLLVVDNNDLKGILTMTDIIEVIMEDING